MSKRARPPRSPALARGAGQLRSGIRRGRRSVMTGVPVHRELDELRRGVQVQLLLDSLTMGLDGLHAQVQVARDLASRLAAPDQVEDLDLAVAQAVDRVRALHTARDREPLDH